MAGRKKNDIIVKDDPSRILDATVEDVMHSSMIPYAEHVILERALPRAEDGLKPVQRRILYTMMELGTTPDKPHRKCARIVGDCLGKYHPHGDSSVYGALVRMAQDFVMGGTMVDGHGNFGSIDGDSAAAMRYTEARMTPLAMLMLRDIEKDTVPFRWNFDDSLKEPDMLPAYFPNLLVNGASGIAVGLATNIPTHNLGEATRAAIAMIDDPDISLEELMTIIPGPDFPTGGILVKNDEIRKGYETGRSKLTLRARVHIEDGSAGKKLIVITEIPYEVNKAAMLEKILRLSEEKKTLFSGISDIRDESDREGMRAVIEVKKDADADKILQYLYKYSDLQVTFGVNIVAIADGKPRQMGLKTVLGYFIRHQKNVVTRRTRYDLQQAKARAHILEGLMIAVDNLDEVIRLIRASKTPKEARAALMEAFALDEIQAQAILDMRLQRLTNLEILALRKEFEELCKLIDKLEGILKSEKKLMAVIRKELSQVAEEFAVARRTAIEVLTEEAVKPPKEEVIPDDAVIVFTYGGQLKRIWPAVLKKNPLPVPDGTDKDKDAARYLFHTATNENLMIFTNLGNCFVLNVGAINECKPKDRGQLLQGLLAGLEDHEEAVGMLCIQQQKLASMPDFLLVSENGAAKRTTAEEYDIRTKKFSIMKLKDDDRLLSVVPVQPDKDLLLVSEKGMAIRFGIDQVPQQGRTAAGVRGIQLENDDKLILAEWIGKGDEFILFSDRGFGKRMSQSEFDSQNRGGKGVRVFPFMKNGSNGKRIAGICKAEENSKLLLRQKTSVPTLLGSGEILLKGRSDKGTPYVMALLEDVVTGLTLISSPLQEEDTAN